MPEIKPCPFCGYNENVANWYYQRLGEPVRIWNVICSVCSCTGPTDLGKSGAIEAWNQREDADYQQRKIEAGDMDDF